MLRPDHEPDRQVPLHVRRQGQDAGDDPDITHGAEIGAIVALEPPDGEQQIRITGGQGEFHMEFSHYDEAPAQVREKVVAEAAAAKSEDS